MSQFRIKKIDLGLPDEWVYRTNDDGATLGDDIVAEDPNDLANALLDTQIELLKNSGLDYASADLIDPVKGALERVKFLEDNVGNIALQDAYDNGNTIAVTPGRPLSLGSGGVILIDSLNNLTITPTTMKVVSGTQQMNISHTGITSSTTNMTVGTTSPSRDATIIGGNDLYFNDGNLLSAVKLSDTGIIALNTTNQNIIGAINEINSGFAGTDFQQIYSQSAPARITTTSGTGTFSVVNGTGSAFTPAMKVTGISEVDGTFKTTAVQVGAGIAVNMTINSDGDLESSGDLKTSTRVVTGTIEAEIGNLTLKDSLGEVDLTSITDAALTTTKQTLFGSINEVNNIANQNASGLAAFASQHNETTGNHEIIVTQAGAGTNADNRFIIKNSSGANVVTANALGVVTVQDLLTGVYSLASELLANDNHRNGDGTDHSGVSSHFADANPHNTVKFLNRFGSPNLSGEITISEGPGITVTQVANNLEISAAAGSTLQGVYDTQVDGNWIVRSGKDLLMKNESAQSLADFTQNDITFYKELIFDGGAGISGAANLPINIVSNIEIESTGGDVLIDSPSGSVTIQGVAYNSTTPESLPSFMPSSVVESLNETINERYFLGENSSTQTIPKGTAVNIDYDNKIWTVVTTASPTPDQQYYSRCFGVTDEDIAPNTTGRIKRQGIVFADVGVMDLAIEGEFQTGDTLYVARQGYGQVSFSNIAGLADGNSVTIDAAAGSPLTLIARNTPVNPNEFEISSEADANVKELFTLQGLIEKLNEPTVQAGTDVAVRGFISGKKATAHIQVNGTTTVGDQFTVGAVAALGISGVTLTAVALGSKTLSSQFEVGVNAEHTAKNLAFALNENEKGSGYTLIKAEASGGYILLESTETSVAMNSVTLSTTSADLVVPASMSGGESFVKLFTLNRDASGKTVTTSNGAAISVSNFTSDEYTSQYTCDRRLANALRQSEIDEAFVRVGKVLFKDASFPAGDEILLLLDIEDANVSF